MKMPEILAPAGNREMAQAAFAAGCDAIYVGAKQFGARAYSKNFEQDELIALIGEAHWRGVKVFLTVNTLLKEEEMEDALAMVRPLAAVGLDAVILQDLGLTARLRKELPHLERHASTQLSVTSLAGAEVLKAIGFTRVVLGRETSHEEAQRIIDETGLEVEIFAHGSLCVSVSGQCLLSAFSGGRSGNRGCCAQPCRKSYTLERPDGTVLGKENTYLSPRDLMTLDEATTFATMGVNALKIEGRMKKPEYVFAAVRAYRAALCGEETHADALRLMTNRPFTKGFIFHDFGVDYTFDQHQPTGEAVGNICRMKNGKLALHPTRALYSGDMLRLQGKRGAFPYTVQQTMNAGESLLFSQNDMPIGSTVYRVYTESVRNDLTAALAADEAHPKTAPLSMTVFLMPGKPLCVQAKSGDCVMRWEGAAVEQARNRSLDQETVERSFRKVGDTHFSLDSLTIHLEDGCFVPVSLLNAARRDALEALWHSLTGKDYTVTEGSTIITLKELYLNSLAAGKHTLAVAFKEGNSYAAGTVEQTFEVKEAQPAPNPNQPKPNPNSTPNQGNTEQRGSGNSHGTQSKPQGNTKGQSNITSKIYNVPVKLMHAYENRPSMGNPALVKTARVICQSNGKTQVILSINGMEFMNMYGHVWNFFHYVGGKPVAAQVMKWHNDKNLIGKLQKFPYQFSLLRSGKESRIKVRVWVDAMDALKNGAKTYDKIQPGSGAQDAYLVLDWSNATLIQETHSAQIAGGKESANPASSRQEGIVTNASNSDDANAQASDNSFDKSESLETGENNVPVDSGNSASQESSQAAKIDTSDSSHITLAAAVLIGGIGILGLMYYFKNRKKA